MTKEESTILKGVAVLLMIFMHLFFKTDIMDYCTPLLFINDIPFVTILSRACGPVPFFIILSGYGLQYIYSANRLNFKSQYRRLLKLYIHYWIILLIFVSIGHFIIPTRYPGGICDVIGNLTSYLSSYNASHWFLFPYALLSLSALVIFKIIDRFGNVSSLLFFFIVSFISAYFISRYIAINKDYDSVLNHILTYTSLLFAFAFGSVVCRLSQKGSLRSEFLTNHPWLVVSMLVLIIAVRCMFTTSVFHTFYVIAFIYLFIHIPLCNLLKPFLLEMGKHSMVMWFVHCFFSDYFFHDFIYGFKNPLLIFVVLVSISYVISFPISWMSNRVYERIMR